MDETSLPQGRHVDEAIWAWLCATVNAVHFADVPRWKQQLFALPMSVRRRMLASMYATYTLRLSVTAALGRAATREDAPILASRWFPSYSRILTLDQQMLTTTILMATGRAQVGDGFTDDGDKALMSYTAALGASLVDPDLEMIRYKLAVEEWWENDEGQILQRLLKIPD